MALDRSAYLHILKKGKPRKYRNKPTVRNNITFQSRKEASRYIYLKSLEQGNVITDLVCQPRYLLQSAFTKNGKRYRKIEYIADFAYRQEGKLIIEDVKSKGTMTEVFNIKRKLLEYKYQGLTLAVISQ